MGQLGESVHMSVHRGTGEVQLHVDMYLSLSLARVCDLEILYSTAVFADGWTAQGAGRESGRVLRVFARVFGGECLTPRW